MINYNNEYKAYYEGLRGKVKNIKVKENKVDTIEDEITPIRKNTQVKNYTGSYRNYAKGLGNYRYGSKTKVEKRKFGYIDKMILKLIITLLLVLSVFIFKISPNEDIKKIYINFDEQINKTYDFTLAKKVIDGLGIDIEEIEEAIKKIENKTSEVMKEILE